MKQNKVTTVFSVDGDGIEVAGQGQETCRAILKMFPLWKGHIVKLVGFNINGKFTSPRWRS